VPDQLEPAVLLLVSVRSRSSLFALPLTTSAPPAPRPQEILNPFFTNAAYAKR